MARDFDSWSMGWVRSAAAECQRQDTTPDRVPMLLEAFTYAERRRWGHGILVPSFDDVRLIAGMVEPENGGALRKTPVTFRNAGLSVPHGQVGSALRRHVDVLDAKFSRDEIRQWTKVFLVIHPFSDGNGRTAWVLFNWLIDGFDDPAPLPYFEFMPGEVA